MAVARLVVDRWLLERRPAPDLADWLVCVWRGDLGEAAMPLPDERLDLVWVDDGSLWLSGPETSSWSRGYPPGTTAVGVGFKPGVGPPVLHLAASEVRDARVRLEALWGDRQARELAERVAAHPDDGGRARELERRCLAACGYGPAVLARMLRLRRALWLARSQQGPLRLAELAAAAGYFDQQHLAHEVRAIMGTTPTGLLAPADVWSIKDTARAALGRSR